MLVATGERTVWRAESDGSISDLSFSADGRRLAYSWHSAGEGNGIRVTDLPGTAAGGVVTTPSRLAVPEQNSLGNLGQAVISPDGSTLSHLGEANVSAPLLMAISGHKRLATLQRYVQPSQAAVAALMAASDPDRRGR